MLARTRTEEPFTGNGSRSAIRSRSARPRVLERIVDQDRELVTADARQRVVSPRATGPAARRPPAAARRRRRARTVVDLLEVVEIDEDQHERPVCIASSRRRANSTRLGSPVSESWCT
jgi:hypothetical protein